MLHSIGEYVGVQSNNNATVWRQWRKIMSLVLRNYELNNK